jgi:hypothetical protein
VKIRSVRPAIPPCAHTLSRSHSSILRHSASKGEARAGHDEVALLWKLAATEGANAATVGDASASLGTA